MWCFFTGSLCWFRRFMCVRAAQGVWFVTRMNVHMSVWTQLVCARSACLCVAGGHDSSPPGAPCLDNVKSAANVLCSSGHQLCVLTPLVILVMSQLILVPHCLNVLFSFFQSHFTGNNHSPFFFFKYIFVIFCVLLLTSYTDNLNCFAQLCGIT